MLVFISATFSLFWIAYRHNYYYVQRNKIDTHGLLFNNALSQLFAGIYVLEIALIGLFFLVRDLENNFACTSQAIIMIVVLVLTGIFHFVMEQHLRPLYEFIPVTLEDSAADAERDRFLNGKDEDNQSPPTTKDATKSATDLSSLEQTPTNTTPNDPSSLTPTPKPTGARARATTNASTLTAASARHALSLVKQRALLSSSTSSVYHQLPLHLHPTSKSHTLSRRREIADQLGAAIASYPDALTDLSPDERVAHLKAAFQDPVTREPRPVVWIPADEAGVAEEVIKGVGGLYGSGVVEEDGVGGKGKSTGEVEGNGGQDVGGEEKREGSVKAKKVEKEKEDGGPWLIYSYAGAHLTEKGNVQITQPAPDVRADWCLEWQL